MRVNLNFERQFLRSVGRRRTAAGDKCVGAQGVALILVMLAMLILSVLAATIVFTARAETFASQNYKLDTQADYLAKAGIQRAVNWLRSTHYQPVRPCAPQYAPACTDPNPSGIYNLTSTGSPYYLYTSQTSPVKTCASPPCLAFNETVQLFGYGSGSSQYPDMFNSETTPRKVVAAFKSDLNDSTYTNNRISGDASDSGYYEIDATLLSYSSVNVSPAPSPVPSYCVQTTVVTCPLETWLITSKAIWTGPSSSTATAAVAEETAIVQPIYWPTWGNALYGFCSVSMSGSAGTCTDAFNSAFGAYGDGTNKTASGACGTSTGNIIQSGAGVGSNGYVSLGSNVTVGGNVTIGSNPTGGSACCTASTNPACGYNGSTSSVLGEVINGPNVKPPTLPKFPTGFPDGHTPSVNLTGSNSQTIPDTATWSGVGTWPYTPPSGSPPFPLGATPPATGASSFDCMSGVTCDGSASKPFMLSTVKMTSNSTLSLVGGTSPLAPVYYDIDQLNQTGGIIEVSGYVVLNVQTALTIQGNGVTGSTAAGAEIPPAGVVINYSGSTAATLGGNGALCALVNAPNSDVTLKGGGSGGYMIGSIQAKSITDGGGYPVHYDVNLDRTGGNLGTMVTTAYGRKKM
jgi:hypothetical protein